MKTAALVLLFGTALTACTKENVEKSHPSENTALNVSNVATFHIGDSYGGGIIYYVDTSGAHGLIASTTDMNGGSYLSWWNGVNKITNATALAIYKGAKNTDKIIKSQGPGSSCCLCLQGLRGRRL